MFFNVTVKKSQILYSSRPIRFQMFCTLAVNLKFERYERLLRKYFFLSFNNFKKPQRYLLVMNIKKVGLVESYLQTFHNFSIYKS